VVCGQLERAPGDEDAVTNPTLLVEVLSDSTETDDRGEKWAHYQRIPTLREYVLVSQHACRLEVFSRDEADPRLWHYREYLEGSRAALPGVGAELDVDEIYADPLSAR
jgi:Uma2 family endonuclease